MEQRDEEKIIKNYEIFLIVVVFSTILYFLFPSKTLLEYALNENSNFKLAEIYLKNISEKYNSNPDILIALASIYLKNNKYTQAEDVIKKINTDDNEKKLIIEFYITKIKIHNLTSQTPDDEIERIYSFLENFSHIKFKDNYPEWNFDFKAEIFNLIENLYSNRKDKTAVKFTINFFNKCNDNSLKKQIILNHLKLLRKYNLITAHVNSISHFEDFALKDDELSYEIIRFYQEANKINLASDFSLKAIKHRGI